jgi:S1-C subfamily serine protease
MRSLFVYLIAATSVFTNASICLAQQTDPSRARLTSEVEGGPGEVHSLDTLRLFNSSLIALAKRVSPAVVQIMVTGYAPTKASGRNNNTGVITREHALGSGVILTSDGYIVTNAHVV